MSLHDTAKKLLGLAQGRQYARQVQVSSECHTIEGIAQNVPLDFFVGTHEVEVVVEWLRRSGMAREIYAEGALKQRV